MNANSIGLICNIAGTAILLFAGFPIREYTAEGMQKMARTFIVPTDHGKLKYWLPRIGLLFLLTGFALQLWAEFCPIAATT